MIECHRPDTRYHRRLCVQMEVIYLQCQATHQIRSGCFRKQQIAPTPWKHCCGLMAAQHKNLTIS